MRRQPLVLEQDLLDLGRKQVDAADDQHVVAAPGHLLHASHGTRRARQQPGEVAGAVANHRARFPGERGEDQLPHLAVGQHLAGRRVDDLGVEVIFPDVEPVLALHALGGDAGADDLRQSVDVQRLHVEAGFDLAAHRVGPRLGAEHADLQRAPSRVQPLTGELVRDRQHVRRGHGDHPGLELVDELHLARGQSAGDGDHGAAETLGAAVKAETAGEQTVAVRDLHHVARPDSGRTHRSRHDVGPHVEVVPGVADHGGLSGGPARRMDAHHLLARHREHPERIVAPQVFLDGEREGPEILQRLEIVRTRTGVVESRPVVGNILAGVLEGCAKARKLQRRNLVATRGFDGVELVAATVRHVRSPGARQPRAFA